MKGSSPWMLTMTSASVPIFSRSLLYAVGAALMVGTGHDGIASKGFHGFPDALVVGRYPHFGYLVCDLFVDSLDDRLAPSKASGLPGNLVEA